MQQEDKYLAVGAVFALVVGGIAFLGSRSASNSSQPRVGASASPPATLARAQALGKSRALDRSLETPYILVEFGDYQCPPCRATHEALKAYLKPRSRQVSLVFRHYPLL